MKKYEPAIDTSECIVERKTMLFASELLDDIENMFPQCYMDSEVINIENRRKWSALNLIIKYSLKQIVN